MGGSRSPELRLTIKGCAPKRPCAYCVSMKANQVVDVVLAEQLLVPGFHIVAIASNDIFTRIHDRLTQVFHGALSGDPSRGCLSDALQGWPRNLALLRAAIQGMAVATQLTEDTRTGREDFTPTLQFTDGFQVGGVKASCASLSNSGRLETGSVRCPAAGTSASL